MTFQSKFEFFASCPPVFSYSLRKRGLQVNSTLVTLQYLKRIDWRVLLPFRQVPQALPSQMLRVLISRELMGPFRCFFSCPGSPLDQQRLELLHDTVYSYTDLVYFFSCFCLFSYFTKPYVTRLRISAGNLSGYLDTTSLIHHFEML